MRLSEHPLPEETPRKNIVEDTNVSEEDPSSLVTDAGEGEEEGKKALRKKVLWQNKPDVRRISTVPKSSGRARCRRTFGSVDGNESSKEFVDLITAYHKILNVENVSRCGHKYTLIEQDEFTNWIQVYPMTTKETMETIACLQTFLHLVQKPNRIYSDNKHSSSLRIERSN